MGPRARKVSAESPGNGATLAILQSNHARDARMDEDAEGGSLEGCNGGEFAAQTSRVLEQNHDSCNRQPLVT